jgi:signal transduction histidine kinase
MKNGISGCRGGVASLLAITVFLLSNGTTLWADERDLDCSKQMAVTAVHSAAVGLAEVLRNIPAEAARVATIRAFVHPVRFYSDQSGYFYVYTYSCVNVAHAAQQDLEGKDLSAHLDVHGKSICQESIDLCRNKGGGFLEFYWPRPGMAGVYRKLGYVEPIPGTDYWIGSGVYLP